MPKAWHLESSCIQVYNDVRQLCGNLSDIFGREYLTNAVVSIETEHTVLDIQSPCLPGCPLWFLHSTQAQQRPANLIEMLNAPFITRSSQNTVYSCHENLQAVVMHLKSPSITLKDSSNSPSSVFPVFPSISGAHMMKNNKRHQVAWGIDAHLQIRQVPGHHQSCVLGSTPPARRSFTTRYRGDFMRLYCIRVW